MEEEKEKKKRKKSAKDDDEKEHKKNWREVYATVEDIKTYLHIRQYWSYVWHQTHIAYQLLF